MTQRMIETSAQFSGQDGPVRVRIDGDAIFIEHGTRALNLSLDDFRHVVAEVAAYRRAVEAAEDGERA